MIDRTSRDFATIRVVDDNCRGAYASDVTALVDVVGNGHGVRLAVLVNDPYSRDTVSGESAQPPDPSESFPWPENSCGEVDDWRLG